MAKHTPRPWRTSTWIPERVTASPLGVCRASEDIALFDNHYISPEENQANARLGAAAPDLLAACEFALSVQLEQRAVDQSEKMNVKRLRAAIAKAKGEESEANND
jgi:hypothetical protein